MAVKLAEAFVQIGTRDQKFQSGLRGAFSSLKSFTRSVAPLAGSIGGAFAVKGAIDSIRQQILAERKLEAVLKATGGAAGISAREIKKLASARQEVTNFGDEATISVAGVLATFKQIKGDQFKDTIVAIQDISSVMGTDMQSSAVQLGKALNDPITGLSALTRIGVSFTQEQKDQIKALQESGDIMGAQKIILAELKSEFGGAAEAMADPLTQVKNTVGDLSEAFGALLLPSVTAAANGIVSLFGPIGDLRTEAEDMGNAIVFAFQNMGISSKVAILELVKSGLEKFPELEQPIQDFAAFTQGTFAGIGAFWKAELEGMTAILKESSNLWKATTAGVSEAFKGMDLKSSLKTAAIGAVSPWTLFSSNANKAIEDTKNAASRFGEGFVKEFAGQDDVKAKNPYEAFAEAAKKTRDEVRKTFEDRGGLSGIINDELNAANQQLNSLSQENQDRIDKAREGRETKAGAAASGTTAAAKKEKFGMESASGLFASIQKNIAGDPQKKMTDATQQTAKNTAAITGKMDELITAFNKKTFPGVMS